MGNLATAYSMTNQAAMALETAEKALRLARSHGQMDLAQRLEQWLNAYRGELKAPSASPGG
jgi:hypothetical protein